MGIGVVVAVALGAGSAEALQLRATGGISQTVAGVFQPIDQYDVSGFTQAGGGVAHHDAPGGGAPSYHAQADSLADVAGLRAHAFSQFLKNDPVWCECNVRQTSSSAAFATYEDFVVSGGTPGSLASTSINLFLEGGLIAGSFDTPLNSTHATSTVQVVFLVDTGSGLSNIGGGSYTLQSDDGTQLVNAVGILAGWAPLGGAITSPSFVVTVGSTFRVQIQLQAFASVEGWFAESFILDANADFGNTLTFATDGPVFNLDPGLTLSSAEAGISGNRWSAPVPEPASAALVMLAAAALALSERRPPAPAQPPNSKPS